MKNLNLSSDPCTKVNYDNLSIELLKDSLASKLQGFLII